jgi:hypothetical protein
MKPPERRCPPKSGCLRCGPHTRAATTRRFQRATTTEKCNERFLFWCPECNGCLDGAPQGWPDHNKESALPDVRYGANRPGDAGLGTWLTRPRPYYPSHLPPASGLPRLSARVPRWLYRLRCCPSIRLPPWRGYRAPSQAAARPPLLARTSGRSEHAEGGFRSPFLPGWLRPSEDYQQRRNKSCQSIKKTSEETTNSTASG